MTPKVISLVQTFSLNPRFLYPACYLTSPLGISKLTNLKWNFRYFSPSCSLWKSVFKGVLPLLSGRTGKKKQCLIQVKTLTSERERKKNLINVVGGFIYLECSSSTKQESIFLPPLNICGFKNYILTGDLEKIDFFFTCFISFLCLTFFICKMTYEI